MNVSTVGFKHPSADLHRKSPRIFFLCLFISLIITVLFITVPFRQKNELMNKVSIVPVIIQFENIPETRHRIAVPAPPVPIQSSGMPIEVDDIMPDDITIEDTILDVETISSAPPSIVVPDVGATAEENEIFEYFAVDEVPIRLENIAPIYPEMAERAGIEGSVTLKVLVSKTGTVDSVVVMEGPEIFIQASIEAARATTFSPAKQNDRPVTCWAFMPFRFVLEQ